MTALRAIHARLVELRDQIDAIRADVDDPVIDTALIGADADLSWAMEEITRRLEATC